MNAIVLIFIILAIVIIGIILFLNSPQFGRKPRGKRLERIKQSPNYRDGAFQNIHHTPSLAEGVTFSKVLREYFFSKKPNRTPLDEIPSIKTNLLQLAADENVLVWFGHSSYFMQVDGKKILVDPVFSGSASPLPNSVKAFRGTDRYTVEDMPAIDYLFISHDHWDHLDYKTVARLKNTVGKVICGLGVGEHLERWGYDPEKIIEKDWNEEFELDKGFVVTTTTGRHFSGRTFKRNTSLWMSFVLKTPTMKLFIGGDSGYDTHFAEIGEKHGEFDLAILENGQYDAHWRYIHMLPDELLKAATELKAKRLLPVHSSKFALSKHPWYEPLQKVVDNNKTVNMPLATPIIGEVVRLDDYNQPFTYWWEGLK